MKTVGIVGSSGYVAGELMRLLVNHPKISIDFVYSHSMPGQAASDVHDDLLAHEDLKFTDTINPNVDVLFLCLGHGHSKQFLTENAFSASTKIIDLGNDFRLNADAAFKGKSFVYGLVEANEKAIASANYIANPGCFATAIQLAILPLAKAGLLQNDVHVNAITGSTGAGKNPSATSHFSWRNNNVSIYKAFHHQHLGEIGETVLDFQSSFNQSIDFLPVRGDFTRGIFASMYTKSELTETELLQLFRDYYKDAAFVVVSEKTVHLKQVVNTNNCFLQVQKIEDKVLVTSVIDNLLKGASGQAVQNMNLMFGWEQNTGLQLKPSYF